MMRIKNEKGFTLIELMMVVALIGIMAALVLVSINMARTRAKDTSFKAAVKSAQAAFLTECTNGASGRVARVTLSSETTWGTVVDCANDGSFSVQLLPNPAGSSSCTDGVATQTQVSFTGCY